MDPLADRFAWVSPYNYAENEPIAHIDLWGLQKYSPQMQDIEEPTDLLSMKMINNLREGAKTVVVELGSYWQYAANKVSELLDSTEEPFQVDGGLAGTAENGQNAETRINPEADYIELDEFTNGTGPKHAAGTTAAAARAAAALEKHTGIIENTVERNQESQVDQVEYDSFFICDYCNNIYPVGQEEEHSLVRPDTIVVKEKEK